MKGTIEKINDNWMVILDQRTWQDPSAEDLILPLHVDDLWVIDHTSYILGEKQELNFQILTVEEGVTPCGTHIIYKEYAKLILKENHIVDTNEMVTMKLYTEEQVINALRLAHSHIKPLQYVIDTLTPIELPSDEEIEEKSLGFSDWPKEKASFSYGAKWMRDKIKNK